MKVLSYLDTLARRRGQRGAALILTVIVIMVLSSLGMAMVTFTSTEERAAVTYRDALQTRALAESGVRLVAEMFRSTDDRSLVPVYNAGASPGSAWDYYGATEADTEATLNAIGIWRSARPGMDPARYTGGSGGFFKGPFKDSWGQVFGEVYSPANTRFDLRFNCTNPANAAQTVASTDCWLDSKLNALLSASTNFNLDSGRITDISFYAPPKDGDRAYGICTVRVTAEKRSGNVVLARETIEAIIGDNTSKPAVMGNGNVDFKSQAGVLCGNGCEQIHANGNITVGPISGGTSPMVTATGTVTGTTDSRPNTTALTTPEINPWDLTYRPTLPAELSRYYLLTAGILDPVWTTAGSTIPGPRPCGNNNMSQCQDYNLEYTTAGVARPLRTVADVPRMYVWSTAINRWQLCATGDTLNTCAGGPSFTVTRGNDLDVTASAGADNADLPFNKNRIPKTIFNIQNAVNGSTVLIDGQWSKAGAMSSMMTVVAVGSISFTASSTWGPAMSNRTMWITGRDLYTHSNCCAPSNTCATNLSSPEYAGITAAHEQMLFDSQNAQLGVILAENRVNIDTVVNSSMALESRQGDHGSICDLPDWPWSLPTTPIILAMRRATN